MLRNDARNWLKLACGACALLCLKGCVLSFDDYPAADLCAASRDAGIQPGTAPDPALRGCEAGAPLEADSGQALAGAFGVGDAE